MSETEEKKIVIDESPDVLDNEPLPIRGQLNVLRYRTIKKNVGFGWWSAAVLIEDRNRKYICFYRWKRSGKEWKRDKKIVFRNEKDWRLFKDSVEPFLKDLDK